MTQQNQKYVILLNGALSIDERIQTLCEGAIIIAADGGIGHAKNLNITPHYWIGDFDSCDDQMAERYSSVEKITFKREKDKTDGSLAIEQAITLGAKSICLIGALGGTRSDHAFAILLEMQRLFHQGIEIMASSGTEEAWPLGSIHQEFDLPTNSLFSILPLNDIKGLSISGAKYPLIKHDVQFGTTHTLSNVVTDKLQISIEHGSAILLARPYDYSGI